MTGNQVSGASNKLDPVEDDLLPAIGEKVLIHLSSSDSWVEHRVVGYYVWGDLGRNTGLHRVFVRVVDSDGLPNARLLRDVRRIDPEPASVVIAGDPPCGDAQKSALPERDVTKPAEMQGVFRKFDVRRVDGSDAPGGKHYGCEYFVLDVDHDVHAPAALRAYAQACKDTHPLLSQELIAKLGAVSAQPVEPAQQAAEINEQLLGRLKEMVEVCDDECWTDDNGYCQAHNLDDVNNGGCRVANAKATIAAAEAKKKQKKGCC